MEVLLIDLGALGIFLGCMAVAYRHGTSHESQPRRKPPPPLLRLRPAEGERSRASINGIAKAAERGQLAHRSESPNADRN